MTEYIWPRNYSGIKLYFCWVVKISKLLIKQYDVLLCNIIPRNHQSDRHNCLIDDMNFKDPATISNVCACEQTVLELSSPFRIHIRTYTAAIGMSLYSKFYWIIVLVSLFHFYSSIMSVCSVFFYNNVMSFCSVSTIGFCQSDRIIVVIHVLCITSEFMTVVITFHCLNRERAVRTTCIRFCLEQWFWTRFLLGQWFWIRFYLERLFWVLFCLGQWFWIRFYLELWFWVLFCLGHWFWIRFCRGQRVWIRIFLGQWFWNLLSRAVTLDSILSRTVILNLLLSTTGLFFVATMCSVHPYF